MPGKLRCVLVYALLITCSVVHPAYAKKKKVLPTEPLATSISSEPNVMFLLDSSGSMNYVLPDAPYDANETYSICPAGHAISENSRIDILVTPQGVPYFKAGLHEYDWSTGGTTGMTGRSAHCFKNDGSYRANLYAMLGKAGARKYSVTYSGAVYTGHYLNWYFGSAPRQWGIDARIKPTTKTRMTVAKHALNTVINSLEDLRVGLATFDGTKGADIRVGVDAIASIRDKLVTEVNATPASGGTPLAESLQGIARYFVEKHNKKLTLHPDVLKTKAESAHKIFKNTVKYSKGVKKESPINAWCQKSFVVMLTDGKPTSDTDISKSLQGYASNIASNDPGYYLDDVAMAVHDIDLRPDLLDITGKPVKNNLNVFTIGFADPALMSSDLLANTAVNGGGSFLMASNAEELADAFINATNAIMGQKGTSASASFNSTSTNTRSAIFSTSYSTGDWTGSLTRRPILNGISLGQANWDAAQKLDKKDPASRTIITYNEDLNQGVPFKLLSDLSKEQVKDLKKAKGQPKKALQYLRGSRTDEKTLYRERVHVLGDIVNSSPIYVAEPVNHWPDLKPFPTSSHLKYSYFKAQYNARLPMVYVGANDGMLHGFDATINGGDEKIAYIPNMLFTDKKKEGLHFLTNKKYKHRFYVDLTPTISDAFFKSRTDVSARWHTILISGMRSGKQGVFALDITDPSKFSDMNADNLVLWEFSSKHDKDLGFTFNRPIVAKLNNGRWAAIFGNGLANSGTGTAKLFILYLDGARNGSWVKGQDYVVIDTKVGDKEDVNGLSPATLVDTNGDHVADRVYAGDLKGNMWAFDLSSTHASQWKVAYGNAQTPKPLIHARSGKHVQAITSAPLVSRHPDVASTISNTPNLMVFFGTGQFIYEEDKYTNHQNAFYGVHDEGIGDLDSASLIQQKLTTSGGMRTISRNVVPYNDPKKSKKGKKGKKGKKNKNDDDDDDDDNDDGKGHALINNSHSHNYMSGNTTYGWKLDLLAGERVTVRSTLRQRILYFNTMLPNSGFSCAQGGKGWIMAVNMLTGGAPEQSIYDINHDGVIDDKDKLHGKVVSGKLVSEGMPTESVFQGNMQVTATSAANLKVEQLTKNSLKVGRISWRQLSFK